MTVSLVRSPYCQDQFLTVKFDKITLILKKYIELTAFDTDQTAENINL